MVRSLDQNATQKIGEMSPTGYTHGEVGLDLGFCYFNPAVVMRSSAVVKCLDQLFFAVWYTKLYSLGFRAFTEFSRS